jgi:hypothetical protein
MPAGKTSGQDSAIGRNLLAQLDPLSRGHPQQIGDTPDDIVLEFIYSAVGVHNFPQVILTCSPSRMEMMRPSSVLRVSTVPVMPIGPLDLSCRLLGGSRVRIQQRSGFNTLGRTGQDNKPANNQDAEHYLDVHRSSPPLRLSGLRSALDT